MFAALLVVFVDHSTEFIKGTEKMPVSVTEIFSVYLMKIMLNCYYFVVCTGCWRFYGKWIINLLNKKNSEINPSDFKSFINSIEFFMLIKIKTPPTKDPCHSFKNSYTEKNYVKKLENEWKKSNPALVACASSGESVSFSDDLTSMSAAHQKYPCTAAWG